MEIRGIRKEVKGDRIDLVGAHLNNIHPRMPEQHKIHIGGSESSRAWVDEIVENLGNVPELPKVIKKKLSKLSSLNRSDKDRRGKLDILKKLIAYKLPNKFSELSKKWRKLGFYFVCILLSHEIEKVNLADIAYLKSQLNKDYVSDWYLKHVLSQLCVKIDDTDQALSWEKESLKSFVQMDRDTAVESIVSLPFEEKLLENHNGYLAMGKTYEDHQNYNCAIIAYSRAIRKDPSVKDIANQQITTCVELKKLRFNKNIHELGVYKEFKCQK